MADSVRFLRPSYSLYFGFLTLSLCIFEWHFGCDAASCQDFFSSKPKPCFPQPINAARKRNITASNTCGSPKSSYCEIGPGTTCFVCDANSSASMHPARFMVDQESPFADTPTWWQSETWWDTNQRGISKMGEPLGVNVTLDFGKPYHISGKIKVTFYSERPQAMIIERSKDNGVTWTPYQFFAKDCLATYGMAPSESAPTDDLLKVICSEDYSGQFPTKNGIVEFQAYTRYSPEDYMQPEIQDYLKATHVRLRLQYPGTDGRELFDSEVTLNKYYYAISDIRADGRCDCHGHAEFCDGFGMNQYCDCEHNTAGRDCEYCKPLYNNQAWKAANKTHANECQKCNCNDHATACRYNSSLRTGACIGCIHNTTGTHCDLCTDGFYRDLDKDLSDPDVCLPCECFPVGIIDNGTCSKKSLPEMPLGQCNCKPNVFGRRCDECVPGYWGFRLPPGGRCQDCGCNVLGALNSSKDCDQQTGSCYCKANIEGEKCIECSDGYYSFPSVPESSCLKCPCDLGGALKICEKQTGLCRCRNNIEGRYCVEPKSGYFYPNLDYLLFEAELQDNNLTIQLEKKSEEDLFTGQGFARLTPGSTIRFKNIRVNVTWQYYIVVRYAAHSLTLNHNLTLSVNSLKTKNEIAITLSDFRVGLGMAWTTNEAISLDKEELYNVSLAYQSGGAQVDGVDLLIDSLVLKPDVTRTRVYRESEPEAVNTLLQCLDNASALATKKDYSSQCSRVVFSYSAEMYDGALACDCNEKGTSQVDRCDPSGGQCFCNEGVAGRTCSYCQAGYYGFGRGNCKVCHCDSAGVQNDICDLTSGICQCKSSATGERCKGCKTGTFNLDSQNPQGCQHCFGYGHGRECKSARGFIASNISSNFIDSDLDGWRLVNNSSDITKLANKGVILDGNVTLAASSKYLGVQLKSYKQRIIIKVASTSTANLSTDALHILLKGNDYQALLRPSSKTFRDFNELSFVVDERHVIGNGALIEFQFQSMLSNLSSFELFVRSRLVLNEIVLETALYDPTSNVSTHIGFAENMTCYENYTGLSCETCASGFTRAIPNSGPFSHCVPCACNNRAKECDPESGICIGCDLGSAGDHCEKCQFNVIGRHCNVCADGFYGLTEDDRNCKPCDCHLPGTQHGNTSSCNVTTGQCKCNQTLHTGGRRCNVCQENAWNRTDSSLNCEECPPCYGMVKVEVDKFRQNFSTLLAVLRSLRDLPIFGLSPSFGERVRTIAKDVEELAKTSEELASKEETVKHELQRAFDTLNIFDGSRKIMSAKVNTTLDAIANITREHQVTMRVMEDIRDLVTDSYYLLNTTINGQVNQLRNSMEILHDWSTTLREIRTQSENKVKNIVRTNDSVSSDLNTASQLTTQAIADARRVVSIFESLLAKIPNLQANSSFIESIGKKALSNASQRYHNASVVFNLTSQLQITTRSPNISEKMSWLSQHAEEVSKNASDITKAVQKLVQSSLDIAHHIQQPLEQLPTLQEQVRLFESRAAEYYSRSRRQQDDAKTAVAEAEELYVDAQNMLATVRDYSNAVQEAKTRSGKSIQDVTELSSFHRSKILFANNVSKSVESTHNLLDTMILLSETVVEHAKDEHKVISKTFVLSKKLKNATAIERGITAKNNTIPDHVRTKVEPVREKCLSTTQDTHEAINNSTRTMAAAVELLTKVTSVSEKLDGMIRNFNALPTINVKPLAGMKSDIARIKENLKALKLTSSLEKLRQGKVVQEKWLAEHKPRVTKLRGSVAFAQNLIASLKNLDCNE